MLRLLLLKNPKKIEVSHFIFWQDAFFAAMPLLSLNKSWHCKKGRTQSGTKRASWNSDFWVMGVLYYLASKTPDIRWHFRDCFSKNSDLHFAVFFIRLLSMIKRGFQPHFQALSTFFSFIFPPILSSIFCFIILKQDAFCGEIIFL